MDNWGLHLIQECIEEVESACRHDAEVRMVASLAETVPEFPFSSPRLKLRFGRHFVAKSVFIIDNSELIIVNSQTGRGYQILLSELRSAIGDELFEGIWKSSTSSRAILVAPARRRPPDSSRPAPDEGPLRRGRGPRPSRTRMRR